MVYLQTYHLDKTGSEFTEVIDAERHIFDSIPLSHSPFVPARPVKKVIRGIVLFCVRLANAAIGTRLLCRDELGPIRTLAPETRELLGWLTGRQYISTWRYNNLAPGYPPYAIMGINPTVIKSPRGNSFTMGGATGNGAGPTLNAAALPALGEFIERLSSSMWDHRRDMVLGTYDALRSRGAVDPTTLVRYTKTQQEHDAWIGRAGEAATAKMHWIPGKNFVTGSSVLLPAATCYTFYAADNPEEPVFHEVNSNGVGAQTSYTKAVLGGIYEHIERDAFLQTWYHQKRCPRISLASLQEHIGESAALRFFRDADGLDLTILDITSDIGVPAFASVTQNTHGGIASFVSAVSDLDVDAALRKLLDESVRFLHSRAPEVSDQLRRQIRASDRGIGLIDNFDRRYKVWSQPEMADALAWFLEGPLASYEDIWERYGQFADAATWSSETTAEKLRQILQEKEITLYTIDLTGPIARHAGLRVVRALSPQLIPLFFNESQQPCATRRFTHDADGNSVSLNPVPHPFV